MVLDFLSRGSVAWKTLKALLRAKAVATLYTYFLAGRVPGWQAGWPKDRPASNSGGKEAMSKGDGFSTFFLSGFSWEKALSLSLAAMRMEKKALPTFLAMDQKKDLFVSCF